MFIEDNKHLPSYVQQSIPPSEGNRHIHSNPLKTPLPFTSDDHRGKGVNTPFSSDIQGDNRIEVSLVEVFVVEITSYDPFEDNSHEQVSTYSKY